MLKHVQYMDVMLKCLYGQRQKCSYMSQLRTWFSYTELRKTDGERTFLINGISNHFSEICIQSIEIHCGVVCPTTFVKSVVKFDLKFIVFLA